MPKSSAPDRPHGQRGRDAQDDVALGDVKVLGQRVEEEDDDEEVEGVERPAEKTGSHGMPVFGVGATREDRFFGHAKPKLTEAMGAGQRLGIAESLLPCPAARLLEDPPDLEEEFSVPVIADSSSNFYRTEDRVDDKRSGNIARQVRRFWSAREG